MNFAVHVEIIGLAGMADPEGRTIERALHALGFSEAHEVHAGKVLRFVVEADDESKARRRVEQMCDELLVNSVIESATVGLTALEAT